MNFYSNILYVKHIYNPYKFFDFIKDNDYEVIVGESLVFNKIYHEFVFSKINDNDLFNYIKNIKPLRVEISRDVNNFLKYSKQIEELTISLDHLNKNSELVNVKKLIVYSDSYSNLFYILGIINLLNLCV